MNNKRDWTERIPKMRKEYWITKYRRTHATWYCAILGMSGKFISTTSIEEAAEFIVKHQEDSEGATIINEIDHHEIMRGFAQVICSI